MKRFKTQRTRVFIFALLFLLQTPICFAGGEILILWEGGDAHTDNIQIRNDWATAMSPYSPTPSIAALIHYSSYHTGIPGLMKGCASQGSVVCQCTDVSGYPTLGIANMVGGGC